jgi:hypothetical protein
MPESQSDLQRISEGIQDRVGLPCLVDANMSEWIEHLDGETLEQLEMDLASLVLERIVIHFPHDKRGRFLLKTNVLLNQYRVRIPLSKDRSLCLVVCGPSRRSDDQELRVELLPLIVKNQSHSWQYTDWFWKGGKAPESELLGTQGISVSGAGKAAKSVMKLGSAPANLGVLQNYGITTSENVFRALMPPSPSDLSFGNPESWHQRLNQTFAASAPWILEETMAREAQQLKEWADAKKGRKPKLPMVKLINMPGSYGARKPGLFLSSDPIGKKLNLSIQFSGSNKRLHESGWKRPLAVDFIRHQIDSPILDSYPMNQNR